MVCTHNPGGLSSIPGQGTKACVPQPRPGAAKSILKNISCLSHLSGLSATCDQSCAGKKETGRRRREREKRLDFFVFASYHGVNGPIVSDFKLPRFNKQLANF